MAAVPLTHHEILSLAAPFTRRGRHVDLAASDRLERRLVFKATPAANGAIETLQLEQPDPDTYRLIRTLTLQGDRQARLQADGPVPDGLLARIDAVTPQQQFESGAGFVLALSHRLEMPAADGPALLILTDARAHIVGNISVTLEVPPGRGVPAKLELQARTTTPLPDDLLAVLGWAWSLLDRREEVWRGTLQLRGQGAARSSDALHKLRRTAGHLAQTLAEPPGRFHDRQRAARWSVTFRRAIPVLACLLLFAVAVLVPQLALAQESVMRMLVFNAPPLLLALFFCLREMPRFEIPPLPRRSPAASWQPAAPSDSATHTSHQR